MNFTAQHSMFEGLFDRVLKPEGEFRQALITAGYDPANSQTEYPIDIWARSLDVTARFLYPQLTRQAAYRAIGSVFVAGYFETIIGRMIAAAFPFFSARAFIQRAPRFLRSGIKEMNTELTWLGESKARLVMNGPHLDSCFVSAGVLDESFRRLKVPVRIEAKMLEGIESELIVDWS
jgi:uncharacterized protein (TIGR02265 family)